MINVALDKHFAVSVDPQLPHDLISQDHLRALHALAERKWTFCCASKQLKVDAMFWLGWPQANNCPLNFLFTPYGGRSAVLP
jgi:hypothetical protein